MDKVKTGRFIFPGHKAEMTIAPTLLVGIVVCAAEDQHREPAKDE